VAPQPRFGEGLSLKLADAYGDCLGGEGVCQPEGENLFLVSATAAILAWIEAPLAPTSGGLLGVSSGAFAGLEIELFESEAAQLGAQLALVGSAPESALNSVFLIPLLNVDGELAAIPAVLSQSADGLTLAVSEPLAGLETALLPLVLVSGEVRTGEPTSSALLNAGHASSADLDELQPVVPVLPASQGQNEGLALFAVAFEDDVEQDVVVPLISAAGEEADPALPYLGALDGAPILYTTVPADLELAPGELLGGAAAVASPEAGGEPVAVAASEDGGGGGYLGLTLGALGAAALAAGAFVYFFNRRAPAVEAAPVAGVAVEPVAVPVGAADDCDDVLRRWRELQAEAEQAEKRAAEARKALEQAERDAEVEARDSEQAAADRSSLEAEAARLAREVEQAKGDVQEAADRMAEAQRELDKAREQKGGGLARTYNTASLERRYRKLADEGKAANQRLQDLTRKRDELAARQKQAAEEAARQAREAESGGAPLARLRDEEKSTADAAAALRAEANEYAERYRDCIRGRINGREQDAQEAGRRAAEAAQRAGSASTPAEAAAGAQAANEAAEQARAAVDDLKKLKADADVAGLADERAEAERQVRREAARAGAAASAAAGSARQKQKDDDARQKREEAFEAQRLRDERRREEAAARQLRNCEAKGPEGRKRTARSAETLMRFTVPYGAEPGSFQHAIAEALNAIDRSKASLGPLADGMIALARGSTKDARDLWAIQRVTSTSYESTCCDGSGHERQVGEPVVTHSLRKLESMTDKQMDLIDGLPEELDDAIDLLDRIKGASVD
jgi:hypothetical protein